MVSKIEHIITKLYGAYNNLEEVKKNIKRNSI